MKNANSALLYGRASDEQARFLGDVLNLGLEFVRGSIRDNKVLRFQSNTELRQRFAAALPEEGCTYADLLAHLKEDICAFSISQSDPRYLAFPDSGNSIAGLAADILTPFVNQNLIAVDRSAPAATFVEAQLIQWLRALIGYSSLLIDDHDYNLSKVGGMWTSGGNMSNHVAVLVALHQRFPELKSTGLTTLRKRPVIVLARGIEHFSFSSAALSLGLGEKGLAWSKPGVNFTTDVEDLRSTLEKMPADSEAFMVVAVAGNCRTTSIDNIEAIRALCDKHGLWLHVDACHGGSLLFSQELRRGLAGIQHADSVSLDPHKGLFVTYPSSYVLFKDPGALKFICRYPGKFTDPDCMDLGLIMPFYGSRGFHSLKLWLLIKHLGVRHLGNLIEQRHLLSGELSSELAKNDSFTVLNHNHFYRLAFVLSPWPVTARIKSTALTSDQSQAIKRLIDAATAEFSDLLYRSGRVVFDAFSLADLDDKIGLGKEHKFSAIALAVGHPFLDEPTQRTIFRTIDSIARPIARQLQRKLERYLEEGSGPVVVANRAEGPAGW